MAHSWVLLSFAALVIWGGWGVLANLTARHLDGFSALVWEVTGAMIVGGAILIWLIRNGGLEFSLRGAVFGLGTGITYTVGLTFLFLALNQARNPTSAEGTAGNVHTILVLTAMYPVIAVVLNYLLLSEPVSLRQIIGMTVGLAGIAILLSD